MSRSSTTQDRYALAAVCLAALMFGLEISSVPVILPTLERVLRGDFEDMQWIMNAYTIACTTVLMAIGTLADRYGRRRVFVISIGAFGIASLACGLAPSAPILIAARFLQGMAGGAMLICQIAVLSRQFPGGAARGRAFGVWGIVFGIGLGFGPIIGAGIALSSRQWVFLVHAPIALLTLGLVFRGVQESWDPRQRKLDTPGIATLSLAVFGLTYFITQGSALGFDDAATLGALLAATVSFVAFVVVEQRSADPMFDFSVFRNRKFSGALLGSAGMNFSFWPFMIYLPLYFQNGLQYDSVAAGLALLAYTLPTLVFPPLGEWLALRYRPSLVIPCGLFAIGAGFMLMRWGSGVAQASWLTMLPGCLVAGIGLGVTNTPVTNTTTGAVTSDRAGMASGIDMSGRMISLAVNIALMGFILVEGILSHLQDALPGAASLRPVAERIAAGSALAAPELGTFEVPSALAQAALVHGFGWVMLYGGLAVWLLAAASFLMFTERAEPLAKSACTHTAS